jgi:hypothetical protein
MVAGDAEHGRAQCRKSGSAINHIVFDVGAVNRHVSRVDDEVRSMRLDPGEERFPVACEVPLARTKVGV